MTIRLFWFALVSHWLQLGLHATVNVVSNTQQRPVIRVPPSDIYSTDGVLEFSCQADGIPKPVISWYEAETGKLVIDQIPASGTTTGIHVNQHYGRLLISNPIRDRIYSFYCNASNTLGWAISEPPVSGGLAYLESSFRQIPSDKTVVEGGRVLLECVPPKGVPRPIVSWLYQDKPITTLIKNNQLAANNRSENSPIFITTQGGLQINAASLTDSGVYSCVATNVAGKYQSPSARLTVEPRIHFLETPKDVRVRQGADVKFRCRAEGKRLVQWSKDQGRSLIDPTRAEISEGYLMLKNVQLSDAGVYLCTAAGSMSAQAVLTVETPPTFTTTPDDLTIHEGETAILHCVTTGYPKPSIYWELADKTPLFPSEQDVPMRLNKRFYLHKSGDLEIRNVQLSDAGRYQCTAHSSVDRIHSSARIRVLPGQTKPTDTKGSPFTRTNYPLAPIIGLPPANQTRLVGELAILDCELGISRPDVPHTQQQQHGDPNDLTLHTDWTVSWHRSTDRKLSVPLETSGLNDDQRYSLLPGGSLQIYDVQLSDEGAYTCMSQTVQPIPNLSDQKSVRLHSNWTAYLTVYPRGSPVQTGNSNDNPLSPPRNVQATNVTESTVTLIWEPSHWPESDPRESANNPFFTQPAVSYWVEFYRPDRMTEGWQIVEQNWQANIMKIGNLQPQTAYYFLIRPRLRFGRVGWASAPLGPVFTLPAEAPSRSSDTLDSDLAKPLVNKELISAVKNVEIKNLQLQTLTPQRIRVSWLVKEKPEILALLSGYTIYYRKVSVLQCVTVSMDETNPGIIDTSYVATDYCSLKVGDVYHHLQNMQALRTATTQINPLETSVYSTDVNTQFSPDDQAYDNRYQTGYEHSGLVRDLQPFHCYEVSVKANLAHKLIGKIEGRESMSRTILTFESFPNSPPREISAHWTSRDDVELSWNIPPAEEWNGLLTGFVVYVYDESATHHETFNISFTERKTLIRGLTGPHAYLIQMAAVNCKGVGVRSTPLRLDPKFRRPGSGVGWSFDDATGLPTLGSESQDRQQSVVSQPWFIGLVISSLLLWLALVILVVCCCRRQRFAMRKNTGGVLITNTSNCGGSKNSDLGGNFGNTAKTSLNIRANGKCKDGNLVQFEPLNKPLLSRADSEFSGKVQNSYNFAPPQEDQHAYGVYSVATGEFQWPTYLGADTIPNRSTNYQNAMPADEHMSSYHVQEQATGLPSMISAEGNHLTSVRCNGTPGNAGTVNYVSNCSPILSAYLGYQQTMLPLSQSINEFHSPAMHPEPLVSCSTVHLGSNGLPLIAPVARLSNQSVLFNPTNLPQMRNCSESLSTSVTPYATTSLVKAPFHHTQAHSAKRPTDSGRNDEWPEQKKLSNTGLNKADTQTHSSYSSSDGSTSCYSNRAVTTDGQMIMLVDDQCRAVSHNIANGFYRVVSHMPNATNNPQSRPSVSKRAQHGASLEAPTVSSHKSQSESAGSNRTAQSETGSVQQKIAFYDPANPNNLCSSSPMDYSQLCNNNDASVYSFIDDAIPPPPASPPPPAPGCRNDYLCSPNPRSHDSSFQDHRTSSRHVNADTPAEELPVYDINVESTEDECEDADQPAGKSAFPSSMTKPTRLSAFENSQPTFCQSLVTDGTKNSTYAQVY